MNKLFLFRGGKSDIESSAGKEIAAAGEGPKADSLYVAINMGKQRKNYLNLVTTFTPSREATFRVEWSRKGVRKRMAYDSFRT